MPSIEKHMEISRSRTGRSYQEVHEWVDEPLHKDERHDITRIPGTFRTLEEKYGEEAAREYVQHLADDLNGKFNHMMDDIRELLDKKLTYFGTKK